MEVINTTYLNEGQKPFVLDISTHQNVKKAEARKLDRKYYKLKGLPSKLSKRCSICGRHGACEHLTVRSKLKVMKNVKPVVAKLLIESAPCTSCGSLVRTNASYCNNCGLYDPFKERAKGK